MLMASQGLKIEKKKDHLNAPSVTATIYCIYNLNFPAFLLLCLMLRLTLMHDILMKFDSSQLDRKLLHS